MEEQKLSFLEIAMQKANAVLNYQIFGFLPFVVFWLTAIGIFLMVRTNFVNFRLFKQSIIIALGRDERRLKNKGEISPLSAIFSAVGGAVGMGNIAGVALAVYMAGPGVVLWIFFFGLLAMMTKSAEILLGIKYRHTRPNGEVTGGPFYYLKDGLAEIGMKKFGLILAYTFAILCFFGSFGLVSFQSNQMVRMLVGNFDSSGSIPIIAYVVSITLAVIIFVITVGGIKRIASIANRIVPFMIMFYIFCLLLIFCFHIKSIPSAFAIIIKDAFNFSSGLGGLMVTVVAGARRSMFSNESGMGTSAIINAAAESSPQRQAILNILLPFIDTCILCSLTGLVYVASGVFGSDLQGVAMAKAAFDSIFNGFSFALVPIGSLLAFTTIIACFYYGDRARSFLVDTKFHKEFCFIVAIVVFLGGILKLNIIFNMADLVVVVMSIPNVIGLYLLSGVIKRSFNEYCQWLKSNKNSL